MAEALAAALQANGYEVAAIPVARDRKDDFLSQYPGAPADAYLDLVVENYGYLAAGIGKSTPYRPFVRLKVRLVRAGDKSVLMQDAIDYNPLNNPENVITISPDAHYEFTDFDALTGDPAGSATGLRVALDTTMKNLAGLLR